MELNVTLLSSAIAKLNNLIEPYAFVEMGEWKDDTRILFVHDRLERCPVTECYSFEEAKEKAIALCAYYEYINDEQQSKECGPNCCCSCSK